MGDIVPKDGRNTKSACKRAVMRTKQDLYGAIPPLVEQDESHGPPVGGFLTQRGKAARHAQWQLHGDSDVELCERAAAHQVLVEEVLEVEATDERVALDAPVGQV